LERKKERTKKDAGIEKERRKLTNEKKWQWMGTHSKKSRGKVSKLPTVAGTVGLGLTHVKNVRPPQNGCLKKRAPKSNRGE